MKINHNWREGNISVDWLANISITKDHLNLLVLETPHRELQRLMSDDVSGACMLRNVSLV